MSTNKTRIARRTKRTRALETLTPLVPVGDWYADAVREKFMEFEGDVVQAIVDGTVLK